MMLKFLYTHSHAKLSQLNLFSHNLTLHPPQGWLMPFTLAIQHSFAASSDFHPLTNLTTEAVFKCSRHLGVESCLSIMVFFYLVALYKTVMASLFTLVLLNVFSRACI